MPKDSKFLIASKRSSNVVENEESKSLRISISNIFPITEACFNIIISMHFSESIILPKTLSMIIGIFICL